MQVDGAVAEEIGVGTEGVGAGQHVAVGDLGGLLHHLAELAGEPESAAEAVDTACLHGQRGAAHGGPGQPGDLSDAADGFLGGEQRLVDIGLEIVGGDLDRALGAVEQLHDPLAHDAREQLVQPPHTGLAGILLHQAFQCAAVHLQVAAPAQPRLDQLPGQQVATGNGDLLAGQVAGQAHGLHAVEQRRRDAVQGVGGADEQHVGQVEAHVQVVVEEVVVLFRVEHLEQGRGRVAAERGADLVHLVQHDHRVGGAGVLQRLHELARHGADVGAAMSLDLCLVAHAAEGEAVEAPTEGAGNGLAERGLAHARRPHQQQDGATDTALHDADAEKLQDAVLDVLQPFVVAVQHLRRRRQVQAVAAVPPPGQHRQPVQVVAGHRVLRRTALQHRELLQFLLHPRQGMLGHLQRLDALAELLHLGGPIVLGYPQFLLDELELLAQEDIALPLLHFLFDVAANLHLCPRHLQLLLQQHQGLFQPRIQGHRFQHVLQLGAAGGGQAGTEVRQPRRVAGTEMGQELLQFLAVEGVERQQLLDHVDDGRGVGLDLGGLGIVRLGEVLDPGTERTLARMPLAHGEPLDPDQHHVQAVLLRMDLVNAAGGTHATEAVGIGLGTGRRIGEDQADHVAVLFMGVSQGFHPRFARQHQGHHLGRKERPLGDRDQVEDAGQHVAGTRQHAADRAAFGDLFVRVLVVLRISFVHRWTRGVVA